MRIRMLAILGLSVLVLLGAACDILPTRPAPSSLIGQPCPFPTPNVIPTPWRPHGTSALINMDGDAELECALIYRYNITAPDEYLLGAVVLDPLVAQQHLSDLAAYQLLPRAARQYSITGTVPGSLPGYLGFVGERAAEIRIYDADKDNIYDELGILGLDAAGRYTTLSLYRWADKTEGYRLIGYFHGSARIQIAQGPTLVQEVTAYTQTTRFYTGTAEVVRTYDYLYDRSGLVLVKQYERKDGPRYEYRANWYEFLHGKPLDTCYFPEGETLLYFSKDNRQVFEMAVHREDYTTGKATVCAGVWGIEASAWRRYWVLVELEKQPKTSVNQCDTWVVKREIIETDRISCQP